MFNFKIYYKADNGKSQSKSEKGAEKSALPLRISPFFAGEDGFKEPEKASMLLFSSVMIVFPLCIDERKGNQTRQCFRCKGCKPDAVHAEQCRQNQDACRLKEKRSGERDYGGDEPVIQCGKEAGGEDIQPCQQEGEREDGERMSGQRAKLCVIADEELRQR